MRANYQGKVGGDVLGTIGGPDLHGALYEAVGVEYHVLAHETTVYWKPVSPKDPREMRRDAFGVWRV